MLNGWRAQHAGEQLAFSTVERREAMYGVRSTPGRAAVAVGADARSAAGRQAGREGLEPVHGPLLSLVGLAFCRYVIHPACGWADECQVRFWTDPDQGVHERSAAIHVQ
jgi:integrase/recombinase XerC